MVVPKMGASWALKKLADEVMTPPAPPPGQPEDTPSPAATAAPPEIDEFDGETVADEEGATIGTARRMRSVAVYVVSDTHGNLEKELESCVLDDESRRYFLRDKKGRIVGIIYAPHPERMPQRAEALRADDI